MWIVNYSKLRHNYCNCSRQTNNFFLFNTHFFLPPFNSSVSRLPSAISLYSHLCSLPRPLVASPRLGLMNLCVCCGFMHKLFLAPLCNPSAVHAFWCTNDVDTSDFSDSEQRGWQTCWKLWAQVQYRVAIWRKFSATCECVVCSDWVTVSLLTFDIFRLPILTIMGTAAV